MVGMTTSDETLPAVPGPGHSRAGVLCHHAAQHGMSCEEYNDLRARAGGHCEICGVDEKETWRGYLVVDHFHGKNGASVTRGMPCDWCNQSVMQCLDGLKPWGENRAYEEAARAYERNPWDQPSDEALRQMAARTEMLPVSQLPRPERPKLPKPAEPWHCTPESITLSLRQGQLVMARKLRRNMTSGQLARLAELLTEEC